MAEALSFRVVPGERGIAYAEQRLRDLGFTQIKRSHDGQSLQVVAPKSQIEQALELSLVEQRQEMQVGPVKRMVTHVEKADEAAIPDSLRDAIADIIFPPMRPNYHSSAPAVR